MTSTMTINGNGTKEWWVNGKRHREGDLPAIERANGDKSWYVNGKLNRKAGLPAFEGANGDKSWLKDGKLHRDGDLPAVEYANGDKSWYVNGKLNREGGLPAIEMANGTKQWLKDGKLHRDGDLPAVERANGTKEWWVNGVRYYPRLWTVEPLVNDMEGQTCVISLETIQNDSEVCKCGVCSSLSLFGSMDEWLRVNENCPHCRSEWTNWVKYRK
jgi:hypothetical protein